MATYLIVYSVEFSVFVMVSYFKNRTLFLLCWWTIHCQAL